jgi:thiol-disulfide isomerase/thioredoxin
VGFIAALVALGVSTSSGGDFEFTMYQGEDVLSVSEYKYSNIFPAEKPVVLNFWAGLCPVCLVDMPHFQAVYDQMGDDFIFLGLDIGPYVGLGDRRDAMNLLRELNITYPAGYVHNRDALAKFRITGTPTTVFLTPDGEVFQTWPGFLDQKDMVRIIQDMLGTSGAVSS